MKAKFDILSAQCSKTTTRLYSTSFSLGIYFLNKKLRMPIYSIYGFVRLADEIVDSFHDYNKPVLFAEFKRDCFASIKNGISLNPVLNSFQHVVNNYRIDHELIHLFLNSMEMDLEHHYTADKYDEYILGSAQVVGLMCLQVFADGDKDVYEQLKVPAMKLGSAFQKVNFLRDLKADFHDLNRSYFPEINLYKFSNAEKKKIEQQIEEDFNEALHGIRQLPAPSKMGVYLAYLYYKKLFYKIKDISADRILSERVRISNGYKFWLMIDSVIRYKINAL